MQSGRVDYAYRLSAARLAILRLRCARRWPRLFLTRPSSARKYVLRALAAVALLMAVSGSAWQGYRAGQQMQVDPVVRVNPPSTPAAPSASMVPVVSVSDRIEHQKESARLAEIVNLQKTVEQLQAQVKALEQETMELEVELLDQQIAFARAEERWKEASVERRVVYNITNIPVGGSVSKERMESDAYLAEVLEPQPDDGVAENADQADEVIDRSAGGPVEGDRSSSPTSASALPTDNQTRQEVFFGPAPDQYDHWANP